MRLRSQGAFSATAIEKLSSPWHQVARTAPSQVHTTRQHGDKLSVHCHPIRYGSAKTCTVHCWHEQQTTTSSLQEACRHGGEQHHRRRGQGSGIRGQHLRRGRVPLLLRLVRLHVIVTP